MRAARNGTGLRLSAYEIQRLGRDNAIEAAASNDDESDTHDHGCPARDGAHDRCSC
jgi:hypothetical protein